MDGGFTHWHYPWYQDTLLASVEAPYYSPSTPAVTPVLKLNLLHSCCQGAVPQLSPTSDLTNGNASLFLVHIASFLLGTDC